MGVCRAVIMWQPYNHNMAAPSPMNGNIFRVIFFTIIANKFWTENHERINQRFHSPTLSSFTTSIGI